MYPGNERFSSSCWRASYDSWGEAERGLEVGLSGIHVFDEFESAPSCSSIATHHFELRSAMSQDADILRGSETLWASWERLLVTVALLGAGTAWWVSRRQHRQQKVCELISITTL